MPSFKNIYELRAWLAANGIDLSLWGTGNAKAVEDLWSELVAGETAWQDDPPLRITRVVSVLVYKGNRTLVEARQTLSDDRERPRGVPPSEKMRVDELPLDAAARCLDEELGVRADDLRLLGVEESRVPRPSRSYPGLYTRYVAFQVEAAVTGLPDGDFTTIERGPNREHGKTHYWTWMENFSPSLLAED